MTLGLSGSWGPHRAREREHDEVLVERCVLELPLAQHGGRVDLRVSRHVAFAVLLEQLLVPLRLDGLPVDLRGGRRYTGWVRARTV